MRRVLAMGCLFYLILSGLQIPYFTDWLNHIQAAWDNLASSLPYLSGPASRLDHIIILLFYFLLATGIYSPANSGGNVLLSLRHYELTAGGKALRLESRSPNNYTNVSQDFIEDICYVERRFNGWLLILIMVSCCLAPGVYLFFLSNSPVMAAPFAIFALFVFIAMLQGKIVIGTADGGKTTLNTTRGRADIVFGLLTKSEPSAYLNLTLSTAFSQRTIHLRKERITGITTLSRFPVFVFLLFLISCAGVFALFQSVSSNRMSFAGQPQSEIMLSTIIVPAILFVIVLVLALKRTSAKLIGGHNCYLGMGTSPEELIRNISTEKGR